jgi:hypothetical protein
MQMNSKLTTCAIVAVCLIFTQLHPGLLAQDSPNDPLIASIDNESQSSRDQVSSTNGRSGEVPSSAANVSQDSTSTQKTTPQTAPSDPQKKNGKSVKKVLLIGAAVAAVITAFLLINKSEPPVQVSVGTPSVGTPQ